MSGKTTRKEDAASIVGEDEAEELESKSQLVGKADVTPGLVVKAKGKKPPMDEEEMDKMHEDEMEEEDEEEKPTSPGKKKPKGGSYLDKSAAFDGAVTLSEAYEHPTQKSFTRLETFALVKRNIEALPETDRLGALSALVDELTDEVQELRTAVEDVYLLQPLDNLDTSEDTPMPTNDYLEQFNEAVTTARQGKTTEEKARLMQEALNNVTGAMKAELAGPMDMVQAFKAAINPLAEQLAQLNARLGGVAIPQQTVVMPTQKSATLTPTINDPGTPQTPVSPITGQPSGLTQIVRRSVGLY